MMEIRLDFDPEADPEPEDKEKRELKQLFDNGGAMLRFWALYKRRHIVDQNFLPGLLQVQELIEKRNENGEPPYDFDWFYLQLRGHITANVAHDFRSWLVKNWEYFSPNIQRKITFLYERLEPVHKQMVV